MAVISKAANANTAVGTGWTNPTNAYVDDDTNLATFGGANGTTWTTDYGFPDFTSSDIPDGSTIVSVTMSANIWQSSAARGSCGVLCRDNGADSGTEATSTSTSSTNVTTATSAAGGITLTDLRSASTLLKARVRCTRTASQAFTGSLDYVYITVTYLATVSASTTADAVIQANSGTKTTSANATLLKTITPSTTVNAVLKATVSPTWLTEAITKRTQTGVLYIGNNDGTGGAVIAVGSTTYTFTDKKADAVLRKTLSGTPKADAVLFKNSGTLTFAAAATLSKAQQGTLLAAAVLFKTIAGGASTNAVLTRTQAGSFSVSAIDLRTYAPTFTVDYEWTSGNTVLGSTTLAAVLRKTISPAGGFKLDAEKSGGAATWISPANHVSMVTTPTLVFQTSVSSADQHFHLQLDKVDTFDGPDLREVKTTHDVTGWEYFNDVFWAALPTTGLPSIYSGNQVRYTVQTALSTGTWYRRVRAG